MADDDKKPEARAAVIVRGVNPGPLVVRIDGRGRKVYYLVHERGGIPQPSGRVFAVARLGAAAAYTVRLDSPHESGPACECISWYVRAQCVHVGMLAGLVAAGRL